MQWATNRYFELNKIRMALLVATRLLVAKDFHQKSGVDFIETSVTWWNLPPFKLFYLSQSLTISHFDNWMPNVHFYMVTYSKQRSYLYLQAMLIRANLIMSIIRRNPFMASIKPLKPGMKSLIQNSTILNSSSPTTIHHYSFSIKGI